ncbi:MAG TPA: aldehyde dehydrogenase family protein, partial [Actinomycetota bacterium]|nr:aldehyde dehydrogenase family protein [Actinomycetota bacterium]
MATTRTSKASKNGKLKAFNPRTGEGLWEIPAVAPGEVRDYVTQARKVAPELGAIDPEGRARQMRKVRAQIKDKSDDIVDVVAAETGKPPAEALAHEVLVPLLQLAYLEHLAPKVLKSRRVAPVIAPVLGFKARMEFRPFGVVGCITPCNFPIANSGLARARKLFAI